MTADATATCHRAPTRHRAPSKAECPGPQNELGHPGRRRSVSRVLCRAPVTRGALAIIPLERRSPAASSSLPAGSGEQPFDSQPGFPEIGDACLCGLAPDGVCHATRVTAGAVGSYPAVSPLPSNRRGERRRSLFCGTLLGVSATGRYPASCSTELGLSSHRDNSASGRPPERRRRAAICTGAKACARPERGRPRFSHERRATRRTPVQSRRARRPARIGRRRRTSRGSPPSPE